MNAIQNSTLLVDGAAAFDEILRCIDAAHSSILINMFIWRDDNIGNKLARAILQAADRGVHVTISIDRVGMILERCEESGFGNVFKKSTSKENYYILCSIFP